MTPLHLRLWNENFSLDEAFSQLLQTATERAVLKEIGKRMLYQKSFTEYQIQRADPQALDELLKGFCQQARLNSPEDLEKWMALNNQTRESLLNQLAYQDQVNRLVKVVVPDEAVKEAFLSRKPRMDTVLFALIRIDREALAKEVFYRLRDDAQDFGALSKQFSVGPEAAFGGVVGPKPIHELNPELRKHLLSLQPGETTEPFTLDGKQFLIARLIRVDSAQLNPGLEKGIREELFEQWTERQLSLADIKLLANAALPNPVQATEMEAGRQ